MRHEETSDWTYKITVDELGKTPGQFNFAADAETCAALAELYNVQKINDLRAEIKVSRENGGQVIHVEGRVIADVVYTCVVTLDPTPGTVDDTFEAFFADPAQAISFAKARADLRAKNGEIEVEMIDERDAPEDIVNGQIDLGDVAAQYFSLALDPYPRSAAAAAVMENIENADQPVEEEKENPFAALKAWKDKLS